MTSRPITDAERDNVTIYQEGRRGFYEVYYLKLNDPVAGRALWLRYTILAPSSGAAPAAELWAIAFDANNPGATAAWKATLGPEKLEIAHDRFMLRIGSAVIHHAGASGSIRGPSGDIWWDLRFDPASSGLRHFPSQRWYDRGLPKTKVLSPNVDARFFGEVSINGRKWRLRGTPGMQAHLWGTRHAESWTWAHVNCWDTDSKAWFEGLTARIKVGPIPIPVLTMLAFHWNGQLHHFGAVKDLMRNQSEPAEPRWSFSCERDLVRFAGVVEAPTARFVGVKYQDPDGSPRFCRNTKLASATIDVFTRQSTGASWDLADRLSTTYGGALEFVSRDENPQVATRI
ncbi:MAG: tocopherol cyclase family protein [Acidobacteriota bacterium]